MNRKLPIHGWDEQDAFTRWKQVRIWKQRQLKRIKRRHSHRRRRRDREEINDQLKENASDN
jgi:hypothetical protein